MGIVKNILSMKAIPPVSTPYSDYAALDLSENFHFHWRNVRFVMDDEEFDQFCTLVGTAKHRWEKMGKPTTHENAHKGEQYTMATAKIKDHPGSNNPFIADEGIRLELSQWADCIHVHWKWMRFELDYQEFLDFADSMTEAGEKLRSHPSFTTSPRRFGTHHVACPRGRVDQVGDSEFWTEAEQDSWLDDRHRTIFLDAEDASQVNLPYATLEENLGTVRGRHIFIQDNSVLRTVGRFLKRMADRALQR